MEGCSLLDLFVALKAFLDLRLGLWRFNCFRSLKRCYPLEQMACDLVPELSNSFKSWNWAIFKHILFSVFIAVMNSNSNFSLKLFDFVVLIFVHALRV